MTTTTLDVAAVPSAPPASRTFRNPLQLVIHQVRFDVRAQLRNRQAQMFTFGMPVIFLVLFAAIFGNGHFTVNGHELRASTYYVANLTTFGIVDAAFMTLVIALVEARETGVLMRRQAAPQPAWVVIAARATTAVATGIATGALLLLIGGLAYGATFPASAIVPLLLAISVGSVACVALAFATVKIIRSVQSAQPVAMALALPMFFISGVFVPWTIIPHWLQNVAGVFPVRHLSLAIIAPYVHGAGQSPWSWSDLGFVAAWGAAGLALAVRRFKWAPQDAS